MSTHTILIGFLLVLVSCSNRNASESSQKSAGNPSVSTSNISDSIEEGAIEGNATSSCDQQELKGGWISNDDESYQMFFDNKYLINKYPGGLDSFEYKIRSENKVIQGKTQELCFIRAENKSMDLVLEYEIMSLSKTTLTLIGLDRGNLLVFTKKK